MLLPHMNYYILLQCFIEGGIMLCVSVQERDRDRFITLTDVEASLAACSVPAAKPIIKTLASLAPAPSLHRFEGWHVFLVVAACECVGHLRSC